jgi:beta-lactamase superfamily II metal-dependent hydrolase
MTMAICVITTLISLAAGPDLDTFTLWQLPEQSPTQMQSHVIRTVNGKVIVIDGGNKAEAPYLRGFLGALGNHVDLWIISHPHADHADALIEILGNPAGITIDTILASLPDIAWIDEFCKGETRDQVIGLTEGAKAQSIPMRDAVPGEYLDIDGVHIKILGVRNPELTANPINNSSMVWRMWDDRKSVLFTGDIGAEAGDKLLNGPYRDDLPSNYVQMSHHGQTGANEAFYIAVQPRFCLWPTPLWLWDNDNGGGKGSGPWTTLDTRAWMERLGVEKHYISKDGLHRIE